MDRILLSPPDVGPDERRYLLEAFDSGWIAPAGPDLDAFEVEVARRVGWSGAVGVNVATAGLHLALLELGVGPRDRVFVSSFTFVAAANAVAYCGAIPTFIDSDASSWNMDPALLETALREAAANGQLPSAVVVVDLFGQCADFQRITAICDEFDVPIVEDAAEAMGATCAGRPAGTLGDIGVFSFNGNKVMTTSGGGMLVVDDADVAARIRFLATQAREPEDHYEHTRLGYNYRLSNLLAAVGRGQLERLDSMIGRRLEINQSYRSALGAVDGMSFMPVPQWSGWNGWLDVCRLRQSGSARCGATRIGPSEHRESSALEADAPAAAVRRCRGVRQWRERAAVRHRSVPPEWKRAVRRTDRPGCHDLAGNGRLTAN